MGMSFRQGERRRLSCASVSGTGAVCPGVLARVVRWWVRGAARNVRVADGLVEVGMVGVLRDRFGTVVVVVEMGGAARSPRAVDILRSTFFLCALFNLLVASFNSVRTTSACSTGLS